MVRAVACAAFVLVLGSAACSEHSPRRILSPPVEPPIVIVYPMHQTTPDWASTGAIAYRDNGVICVDITGGYLVDPARQGIWSMPSTGGPPTQIARGGYTPAWSPDGSKLSFQVAGRVYVANADGTSPVVIATTSLANAPAWSPDGTQILYDVGPSSTELAIWVAQADGSNPHLVVQNAWNGTWDPSGRFIVSPGFLDAHRSHGGILKHDVLRDTTIMLRVWSPSGVSSPRFSPDGSRLVFSSGLDIWTMDADGSNATRADGLVGSSPAWSPDGSRLIYARVFGYEPDAGVLWIDSLATGARYQLTHHWPPECP